MKKTIFATATSILLASSTSALADGWEFSGHFGQTWTSDLTALGTNQTIAIDDGNNYGFGIAWNDSPNGMGQVLFNFVSHDYVSGLDQQKHSLDITYGHFNGVALFRQENYVTTVSLGLGGAMFDTGFNDKVYPSATISIGTRYEFSDKLAFFTELRSYGSLVDEEDQLFCQGDSCHAEFEDSLWLEANISVGISYRF